MRNHVEDLSSGQKQSKGITALCQVCRYIPIDQRDPTLNPAINDRYKGSWLEP